MPTVNRGELWRGGHRPVLVISNDQLHRIPIGLLWILPLTTSDYGVPNHVGIDPPEGNLPQPSFVMCEQIRTITEDRLDDRIGEVDPPTLQAVDEKVRWLLGPAP